MNRRDFLKPWAVAPLLPTVSLLGSPNQSESEGKPATAYSRPYVPDPNWPKLPPSLVLGAVCSVTIGEGRLWVLHRGNPPVLCLDREGRLLKSWGDGHIQIGHHIRVDSEGYVWVADIGHHQILKFTPEGRVVMEFSKKDQPGKAVDQFNEPTDIAVLP